MRNTLSSLSVRQGTLDTSATLKIGPCAACELIANATASVPISLAAGFAIPGGSFIYALTFTLLDLANEKLGRQGTRRVVCLALAANVFLAAYVQLVSVLARNPSLAWNGVPAHRAAAPRIVVVSTAACRIASFDVAEARITPLAGKTPATHFRQWPRASAVSWETPLRGLSIARQLKWMKRKVKLAA